MAQKLQINLQPRLHSLATRRAGVCGYSNLADYIVALIQADLTKAGAKLPPRVRVSRESILKIRKRLLDGIMSYMKASENPGYGYTCGYRLKHIDRCAAIINSLQTELSEKPKPTPQRILQSVKRAVLRLNKLNASCGGALIETDQREDLCQLIFVAACAAGLTVTEDITEQWREW